MYWTLTDANDWLDERGKGPITEEQLVAASDYLDAVYSSLFVGSPSGSDAWPRTGAVDLCTGQDITGVPDAVKHAAALIADSGVAMSNTPVVSGAKTLKEGALSVTFRDGSGSVVDGMVKLPMAEAMLRCLIEPRIPVRLV